MEKCKHVAKLKTSSNHSILNPQKWLCSDCGTTESVWACFSCPAVACGRYNESHALQHFKKLGHPLAIEVNDKYVFCYICDDYVLNDNAASDLKIIRGALDAVATQSFSDCNARSRRILRSNSFQGFSQFEDEKKLLIEDQSFTALTFRRYHLLAKAFQAWREYAALEKGEVSLEELRQNIQAPSRGFQSQGKKALVPGIVGLRNLGNTCYMNSILQILSHIREFRNFFLGLKSAIPSMSNNNSVVIECFQYLQDGDNGSSPIAKKKGGLNGGGASISKQAPWQPCSNTRQNQNLSLCQELHALVRVMWSGKWALVSPHKMLSAVWKIIPFFRGFSQQDAQEFLCEVLDKVDNELHKMFPSGASDLEQGEGAQARIVDRLFQGQLLSEVTCLQCHTKSQTMEPFMDLSLEFPDKYQTQLNSKVSCHINEMLSKFTEVEKLDGEIYACESCASKRSSRSKASETVFTEAKKCIMISKPPKVLRLHLKRFMWSGRNHRGKICCHVKFGEMLDLAPFCCGNDGQFKYRLSAVVMHHGRGFSSGHYTAYCWHEELGKWFHCNDSRTLLCSFDDVIKSQAYILFYTLQDHEEVKLNSKPRDLPSKSIAIPQEYSSSDKVYEEKADDEITFNYKRSQIPHFVRQKRKNSELKAGRVKRSRTMTW